MKRPLQEAAELFRQLEGTADHPREYYRALSLVAEGLHGIEKRLEQFEEITQSPRPGIFNRRSRLAARRAVIRAFPV